MKTLTITKIALFAALYAALSLLIPTGSGMIQLRVAEVLNLLAAFNPIYIVSLGLGCLITNILTSPLGWIDWIVGTGATVLSAVLIWRTRKNLWLASLWPVLLNGIIISAEGALLADWPFAPTALGIAASELIMVTIIGVPLIKAVTKNIKVRKFLES
ncbi:MAG: QueT transporter family protein [Eubacteriales bacterium]